MKQAKSAKQVVSLKMYYIHLYSPFQVDNETYRNEQTDGD